VPIICETRVSMDAILINKDHCAAELLFAMVFVFETEVFVDGCTANYYVFLCSNSLFSCNSIDILL
jgi:hypothetical protein